MRVVITGIGVVSSLGIGQHPFWDGLMQGQGGGRPIQNFDASAFPIGRAAEVDVARITPSWLAAHTTLPPATFSPWDVGDLLDRKVSFGILAALEAWRQAGQPDLESAWLSLGVGLEYARLAQFEALLDPAGNIDWRRAAPQQLRVPADRCGLRIAELLSIGGPQALHCSACASGGIAMAHGASLISRGRARIVICGGTDSMINPLGLGGMSRLGAPSPTVCRPFDRRRDGLLMGEGAAIFVLESAEHAQARGVEIIAEILGSGVTQDAYKATAPRPDAQCSSQAMKHALTRAGLAGVDYLNAHGTGTRLNDPVEALAINSTFSHPPLVSSIKGAVGHLMAASGAIELAACALALKHQQAPGTLFLEQVDAECALPGLLKTPQDAKIRTAMSTSFGFGGQNAAVILGRST